MKKHAKQVLSVFLAIWMVALFAPLILAGQIEDYEAGDLIRFGTYPQSQVTDESLIETLNQIDKTWVSYNYSIRQNNKPSKPDDSIKYCDFFYNGTKYRAVFIQEFRGPYNVTYGDVECFEEGYMENGYKKNTVYYFKYEPLIWRILDPDTGMLLSQNIIDSQPFQETVYSEIVPPYNSWQNETKAYYANHYATSSIRQWLNHTFYDTAFTLNQKKNILTTKIQNTAHSSEFNSPDTNDKVYMLSYHEAEGYAFTDGARTDYSKSQGLSDIDSTWWRLRTGGDHSSTVCICRYYDSINYKRIETDYVNSCIEYSYGIRPVINLSILKSDVAVASEDYASDSIPSSGFRLELDNNSFCHTNDNTKCFNAGFVGQRGYEIDDPYWSILKSYATSWEQKELQKEIHNSWFGSCYGIAVSMGLKYTGLLSIDDLTSDRNVNSYFTMPYPYQDTQLKNVITFYQLSQYLNNGGQSSAAISKSLNSKYYSGNNNGVDSLSKFLIKLVREAKAGRVFPLTFSAFNDYNELGGHAVLVVGYEYDIDRGKHIIKIYDENTVSHYNTTGDILDMDVDEEYDSFRLMDGNLDVVTENNYYSMKILNLNALPKLSYNSAKKTSIKKAPSVSDKTIHLKISCTEPIQITNKENQVLCYNDYRLLGDMPILNTNFQNSEKTKLFLDLEIPYSESFSVQAMSSTSSLQITDGSFYVDFSGTGIETGVITVGKSVELTGNNMEFEASVSHDTQEGTDAGLMTVSAQTNGNVEINKEKERIIVTSNSGLTETKATAYYENLSFEREYGDVNEFEVQRSNIPHAHLYITNSITESTCTTSGHSELICTICNDTYTEVIPSTGNHTDADNDGKCDTCGEQMKGGDHCKFCGKIHNGGFFDKLTGFFHKIFAIFKR